MKKLTLPVKLFIKLQAASLALAEKTGNEDLINSIKQTTYRTATKYRSRDYDV